MKQLATTTITSWLIVSMTILPEQTLVNQTHTHTRTPTQTQEQQQSTKATTRTTGLTYNFFNRNTFNTINVPLTIDSKWRASIEIQ
jgi:hypothetical protein